MLEVAAILLPSKYRIELVGKAVLLVPPFAIGRGPETSAVSETSEVATTPEEFVLRKPLGAEETVRLVELAVVEKRLVEVMAVEDAKGSVEATPSPRMVVVAVRPM